MMSVHGLYVVWAAIGPLLGVIVGGLLTAWWQRRQWILDNKAKEYREILAALYNYQWRLLTFHSKRAMLENIGIARAETEEKILVDEAQTLLYNALADRLFTRTAMEKCGAYKDFKKFTESLISNEPPSIHEVSVMLTNLHSKLVQTARADVGLAKRFRHRPASIGQY